MKVYLVIQENEVRFITSDDDIAKAMVEAFHELGLKIKELELVE